PSRPDHRADHVWWRRGGRLGRGRGLAPAPRARGLRRPDRASQDPGTHHGDDADRQTGAQLSASGGTSMTRQVQDAYIVAARRTAIGKAPKGGFRNVRPDDLLVHAIRSMLADVPSLDPAVIEDAIVGCAIPEAEQGLNVARMAVLLAGLPKSVGGVTVNRF